MSDNSHSIARRLIEEADRYRLRDEFYTVGDAAALVTNELTPAGFYTAVRSTYQPDGYILGAGCGNAVAMVEAFPGTPRGMVLVDVDPAVIFIGNMLVTCLARHATVEGFVGEFFCGGRSTLESLFAEVRSQADPFAVHPHVDQYGERLWGGLAELTEAFTFTTADVPRVLADWKGYLPPQGQTIPVRTYMARNYAKLHQMAAADCIVLVRSSLFSPELLDAVARLPGFGDGTNLVYASNVVDHILRRSMFTNARAKLRLAEELPEAQRINSTADFVPLLNEITSPLEAFRLRGKASVFVHSIEGNELILEASPAFPTYDAETFYFQFDLDQLSAAFLGGAGGLEEAGETNGPAAEGAEDPWPRATAHRRLGRGLYADAVRGDGEAARGRLERLVGALDEPNSPFTRTAASAQTFAAFWLAETSLAVLFVGKGNLREALRRELDALEERLAAALAPWPIPEPEALAGDAPLLALHGQALAASALLLNDPTLATRGEALIGAAVALQNEAGFFGGGDVRRHTETLLRLVLDRLHHPERETAAVVERGVAALLGCIDAETGRIDLPPEPLATTGLGAYLSDEGTVYGSVRLLLLFHGLMTNDFPLVRHAMRVYAYFELKPEAPEGELTELLNAPQA
jgi:hypothetical protein